MQQDIYQAYIDILKEELVPAMGCTEPIAIAYASSKAKQVLDEEVSSVVVTASNNIIKNVKSVIVPNTGSLRGIKAAAIAGIVAGDADKELQVLSNVTQQQIELMKDSLDKIKCKVKAADDHYVFYIGVEVIGANHKAFVEVIGSHTNIVKIVKDDEILFQKDILEEKDSHKVDHNLLKVKDIVEFADEVDISDVKEVLDRQIECNTTIANEGLKNDWGANIGSILLSSYGNSVHNKAKAYAAAGSDARMSGCELAVVINSGSGNQGLTASLPVIVYANELKVSRESLYRALVVSNLVTIHLKTGIGPLSAYCGATSAGAGAGAGITYLYGGKYDEIAHTIVNALAINSGMICDGAKPSCAAKIASAVEAGLLGMQMQSHDSQFYDGEGIVVKGVENTINNVSRIAHDGMKQTDSLIIKLMTDNVNK